MTDEELQKLRADVEDMRVIVRKMGEELQAIAKGMRGIGMLSRQVANEIIKD
jgi:hypothetical protein